MVTTCWKEGGYQIAFQYAPKGKRDEGRRHCEDGTGCSQIREVKKKKKKNKKKEELFKKLNNPTKRRYNSVSL